MAVDLRESARDAKVREPELPYAVDQRYVTEVIDAVCQ